MMMAISHGIYIYIHIYIYMKGCEIVLGFFFEQVWEFFLISWLVQFA